MVGARDRDTVVCTLTDRVLAEELADAPRVALTGPLATANIGIERIVAAVLGLPRVRHLVVCGADSPLFRQGQTLLALARNGCAPDGTVIGASGYRPVVPNLGVDTVAAFRDRVLAHDLIGVRAPAPVRAAVAALPETAAAAGGPPPRPEERGPRLVRLPVGGRRTPVGLDRSGYFVVDVDRERRLIVLRRYDPTLTVCHEARGHSAEGLLLTVVRHGLLTDPAHAGYLGGELVKAETALRLGLPYVQDHPLRRPDRRRLPGSGTDRPPRPRGIGVVSPVGTE